MAEGRSIFFKNIAENIANRSGLHYEKALSVIICKPLFLIFGASQTWLTGSCFFAKHSGSQVADDFEIAFETLWVGGSVGKRLRIRCGICKNNRERFEVVRVPNFMFL